MYVIDDEFAKMCPWVNRLNQRQIELFVKTAESAVALEECGRLDSVHDTAFECGRQIWTTFFSDGEIFMMLDEEAKDDISLEINLAIFGLFVRLYQIASEANRDATRH